MTPLPSLHHSLEIHITTTNYQQYYIVLSYLNFIIQHDPDPFIIIDRKGTTITAKRHDKTVKRNSSFFKKVPNQKSIEEWFHERKRQPSQKIDELPDYERKEEKTGKEPERK